MAGQGSDRTGDRHPTALLGQTLAAPGWAEMGSWVRGDQDGGSGKCPFKPTVQGTEGEEGEGIQRQHLSKSHSPSQLCIAAKCFLINTSWDYFLLLRVSKGACAIILRTDRECKPAIFFSSLSKSDDQLWL